MVKKLSFKRAKKSMYSFDGCDLKCRGGNMSEYKDRNDYEREKTQKCDGPYTPEEIELNKKLYEECSKEVIDFEAVENLLKQGADPLGPTEGGEWGSLEHIYGEIVMESQDNDRVYLPRITELFLKYGMDIDHPRVPYDGGNSINPLWDLGLALCESSIETLKLLLDRGISVDSFGKFWSTAMGDLIDIECGDPVRDEFWNRVCVLSLKATMLAASYDYILNEYEHLRKFIGYSYNNYDVHNFRNWNDYMYKFDTSHCNRYRGYPELYKSVVTIYEIESKKEVWKFGVYLDEGKF